MIRLISYWFRLIFPLISWWIFHGVSMWKATKKSNLFTNLESCEDFIGPMVDHGPMVDKIPIALCLLVMSSEDYEGHQAELPQYREGHGLHRRNRVNCVAQLRSDNQKPKRSKGTEKMGKMHENMGKRMEHEVWNQGISIFFHTHLGVHWYWMTAKLRIVSAIDLAWSSDWGHPKFWHGCGKSTKCPHNLYSHLWIIYENFIHHIHHINHHLWMLRSWSFARSWTQQPRLEIFLSGPLKINSGCWFIDVYRVIYIYIYIYNIYIYNIYIYELY